MYALNSLNGLANAYLLLLYWGFSAGPASLLPYFILGASLLLHFVCTVVSLFRPKVGAVASVLCSLVILFWQSGLLGGMLDGGWIPIAVFTLLVGACWMLIFKAIKILLNKNIHWESPNLAVNERLKLFFSILPFSVLILYII
jgi:hypothetical protein